MADCPLTANQIREASLDACAMMRRKIERMSDSRERSDMLRVALQMESLWMDASDAFAVEFFLKAVGHD